MLSTYLSTYFFVNPFELPYLSYDIQQELVEKPSMISYFPNTFCLMIAQSWAESIWEITNYGRFINSR